MIYGITPRDYCILCEYFPFLAFGIVLMISVITISLVVNASNVLLQKSQCHILVYFFFSFCHGKLGGSVAEWLACWTQTQKGLGFKSQPRRCRVTVLGKLFTPIMPLFTGQRNSLRVAMVTAGLAESNGSLLLCSLAVLDPIVGHTMDILSPFIPVLCHSD